MRREKSNQSLHESSSTFTSPAIFADSSTTEQLVLRRKKNNLLLLLNRSNTFIQFLILVSSTMRVVFISLSIVISFSERNQSKSRRNNNTLSSRIETLIISTSNRKFNYLSEKSHLSVKETTIFVLKSQKKIALKTVTNDELLEQDTTEKTTMFILKSQKRTTSNFVTVIELQNDDATMMMKITVQKKRISVIKNKVLKKYSMSKVQDSMKNVD